MNDYRKVLVHVSGQDHLPTVLACAANLAAEHGAALHAVYAVQPIHLGAHLSPETAMLAFQLRQDEQRKRTSTAREQVLEAARSRGMSIDFQCPGGDPLEALIMRSRAADLVVMGQPSDDDPDGPSRRFASQLLVGGGCPILFVPGTERVEGCATRVLVAWSATRESTRALRDALPMLQRATVVEVLSLGSTNLGSENPLDAVAAYLHAHGVSAACAVSPVRNISFGERMLTPSVVDASIAELLLSHAADMEANLIVMGGYGHSRTYELVLGGVTRTMLESMTVPVLMSH